MSDASPSLTQDRQPALELRNVVKSFGWTYALKGVSVSVQPGTVHALVGENGAGKSTALGVLAGRVAPTGGEVRAFGADLHVGDPRASRRAGVVAIYQELTIVPALSAEANVFLGQVIDHLGFLAKREMRNRYERLCADVGVTPEPRNTKARQLSIAQQQVLEILRALVSDAKAILFDEPTAALAVEERAAFYRIIEQLRRAGVTVMFVSHNLDEVLDLSDHITVFRDGEVVVSAPRADFDRDHLVRAMLGQAGDDRLTRQLLASESTQRQADAQTRAVRVPRRAGEAPLLAVKNVTVKDAISDLEIEIRAGEMVGVGGLVGSGRTTLLRAIAGAERVVSGRMYLRGVEVPWPPSVRHALGYGIALLPEDRKGQGLVLSMLASDNVAMGGYGGISRFGFLSSRGVASAVADTAESFGLQRDRLRRKAWQLSGGNQQKLLLARWKQVKPAVLLADEPTRGIDIGAKAEIMSSLERMVYDGLGLVFVSSELEEVAAISDRVYVLSGGQLSGELERSRAPISASEIVQLAFRHQGTSASAALASNGSSSVSASAQQFGHQK